MADGYQRSRASSNAQLPSAGQLNALSKAQQFEDEKRRIITSCFAKTDTDGSLLESYITHCKVTENAAYPSHPAPPEAPHEQKKSRVILVAVRKSGRVRVHKARENSNGSFSIGKTWNLDDLQQIENHAGSNERGFTVTILKPYYWEAGSSKEKDFFISSLLKIYKKYTAGKIPSLVGFERTDVDRLLDGAASNQARQRRQEDEMRPPRTPTTATSGASMQAPYSAQKNLTQTPSMESMTRPPRAAPSPRAQDGFQHAPNSLRTSPSNDHLSSHGNPEPLPMSRNASVVSATSNDAGPPPIPVPAPGRKPSDGSSRSGSRKRSNSRPPRAEDERSIRGAASTEMFRAPSASSQKSREAPEYATYSPHRAADQSPSSQDSLMKKNNSKDVAAQFRLAANAYAIGGAMGRNRPKTPTKTPTTPTTPMSRGLSQTNMERTPDLPQIKYPEDRKDGKTNGSTPARKVEKDERRSRSPTRTGGFPPISLPMPLPQSPAPAAKIVEPPPRNEARRPGTSSRDENILPPAASVKKLQDLPDSLAPGNQRSESSVLLPPTGSMMGRRSPSPERLVLGTTELEEVKARSRSKSPNTKTRKRKSNKSSLLEDLDTSNVAVDIEELLKEFNWDGRGKIEVLEADIKKELANVESRNVIINNQGDDRIEELSVLLDKAIKECEEMDGLLTLYAVELTSLNDDIAHIENQSQGLQVQTANQKTLQRELQNLLSTISIAPQQLEVLKQSSLDSPQGLERIESTLLALYKAMVTIDPHINHKIPESPKTHGRRGSWSDEGIENMRALQERKDGYRHDTRAFFGRLRQFMNIKFQAESMELGKHSRSTELQRGLKPKMMGHDSAYFSFWRFAGLIAFAKDVDKEEYLGIQKLYEKPVAQLFQDEFVHHVLAWKKITRKPVEESELVFTAIEKETDNVAVTAARKLTVKRSQTLAKIRSPTSDSHPSKDKSQEGKIYPHEAFAGALAEVYNMIIREQNFVVEFFHMSSQGPASFIDFVGNSTPESRRLGDLGGFRTVESDKAKARMVLEFMTGIFAFLTQELQNLVDWAIKSEPVQGVGVLYYIEEKLASLEETNQEFLIKTLQKLHDRLAGLFSRFFDEQVKAIEDFKVKVKKRRGVIGFMRVFPAFCAKIEEQLPPESLSPGEELDVREMVNDGYNKINKAMFESLQAIAKESPSMASTSIDPEDKEQLNYHIMMIENMHHYLIEVETRMNSVLQEFKRKAEVEFKEHMGLYVGAVIRRPLGKLLDFVEGVEMLAKSGGAQEDISQRQSHSKMTFRKVLGNYDAKEIKRGIETLRKRVDKHFGDSDDPALCAKLLEKIFERLETEYIQTHKRVQLLLVTVYKEQGLELEFTINDINGAFRK
ncbi:hypothetical protein RUND412_007483 [Rhizina undulata]